MISDRIKKGVERAGHRSLLFATGITRSELDKPMIACLFMQSVLHFF